jgi:hypothetical protein
MAFGEAPVGVDAHLIVHNDSAVHLGIAWQPKPELQEVTMHLLEPTIEQSSAKMAFGGASVLQNVLLTASSLIAARQGIAWQRPFAPRGAITLQPTPMIERVSVKMATGVVRVEMLAQKIVPMRGAAPPDIVWRV